MIAGVAACWAAAPAFSQVPDWSLRAQQRLADGPGTSPEARRGLLEEGERLLATREAAAAESAFDRAALMLHAADTEIALVRTYMQMGQYRRALAFCAHAAGVHRDVVAAAALYVWLLDAGGQPAVARQKLDEADALYPGEPLLAALRTQLAAFPPRAVGVLRSLPARLAPYASVLPANARVAGAAVLLPDASAALAPAAVLAAGDRAWLRNGLGETVPALAERSDAPDGVVLLRPTAPLAGVPEAAAPPRDPFGGRQGFVVGHAARADAESDWPRMRMGFLGALGSDPLRRRLGIVLPGDEGGSLVLDEQGRFVGLSLAGGNWMPGTALRSLSPATAGPEPGERIAPDAAYERGLRLALQVLVPTGGG